MIITQVSVVLTSSDPNLLALRYAAMEETWEGEPVMMEEWRLGMGKK